MRTLFICAKSLQNKHIGEEYDDVFFVDDIPAINDLEMWAQRIADFVRTLWVDQKDLPANERKVVVILDGHAAYKTMIIDLQLMMRDGEKIVIEFEGKTETKPEEVPVVK